MHCLSDSLNVLQTGWPAGLLQDKLISMMPEDVRKQRASWNSSENLSAEGIESGEAVSTKPVYKSKVPQKSVDSTAAVIARMEASLERRQRELQEQANEQRP